VMQTKIFWRAFVVGKFALEVGAVIGPEVDQKGLYILNKFWLQRASISIEVLEDVEDVERMAVVLVVQDAGGRKRRAIKVVGFDALLRRKGGVELFDTCRVTDGNFIVFFDLRGAGT